MHLITAIFAVFILGFCVFFNNFFLVAFVRNYTITMRLINSWLTLLWNDLKGACHVGKSVVRARRSRLDPYRVSDSGFVDNLGMLPIK